ncbi:hypothetical protein MMC11_008668, partial [Xylographa trunciseda]|nr:hypothetical protein [Xylographa trunciseda]
QQSVDLDDSPSEQLRRENMISASTTKQNLIAATVEVQRVLDPHGDAPQALPPAELSAKIFNNNLEANSRNTFAELGSAIVLEPTALVSKKRALGCDAIQSPSKRLRYRPTRAAAIEGPIGPLSSTIPSNGRLKRPTQIPTKLRSKSAKARAAEEVYELSEDSPLKPKKSLPAENNDAVHESREDVASNRSRSVAIEATSEPKEAKRADPEVPRKRGRPPKLSTNTRSRHEASFLDRTLPIHDHVVQSGSTIQPSDKLKKSVNAVAKSNDSTGKLNGRVQGKKLPSIEGPSFACNSASTALLTGTVPVDAPMDLTRASQVSHGTNVHRNEGAEGSSAEEQEVDLNDKGSDFVDEQSDEIEDDSEEHYDQTEFQENGSTVPDEGECLDDRGLETVPARLDREGGHASLALEIFGAETRWKDVLQAARSVGLKRGIFVSSDRRVGHNISLETKPITKFLEKIKEVGLCYKQAKSVEDTNIESRHNLRSRLRDYTLWLKKAIDNIRNYKWASKSVKCIQDIYVHAIPHLVFLLEDALNAQSTLYSANEETESLTHIIGVQGLVVELCMVVGPWSESARKNGKSLPISDLPIKGATSRKILPYLRDIGDKVQVELDSIREQTRRARDESARIEMYHAREARWQEKRDKNRLERDQKQRQAAEDALRLSGHSVTYTARPYCQTPSGLDQWTNDQDRELLRLLWDHEDLPGSAGIMASTDIDTPLETPPAEERLPEVLSSEGSPTMTTRNTSSREGHKPIISSPRRNGIPPKRPTTTIKRAEASAPTSTSKPAASARTTPGSGLSKPPSRPTPTSSARRPVPGVITSTASNSVHKPRPSTSSVEEIRKAPAAEGSENKRPIVAGAAKRVSLAPSALTKSIGHKVSTSADRRSTLSSAAPAEMNVSSSRPNVISPTRVSTKSVTTSVRSGVSSSILRSGRAAPSSARAIHGTSAVDASKKRLSTIPASPAPAPAPTSKSIDDDGSPSAQGLKPTRPSLGPRKSTMSVTIEQRLQEMELVNEMLKIAMAEDGEESDEVKEEYGRKVDETLADLREQLEEARRKEGKPPLSSGEGTPPINEKPSIPDFSVPNTSPNVLAETQIEELQAALTASQEKVATLEADLEYIQRKMNQYSEEAAHVSKDVEIATEQIRSEHVSKIEELSTMHAAETEALCNRIAEAESIHSQYVERSLQDIEKAKVASIQKGSEKATRLLGDQQRAHEVALKALRDQLNTEKNNGCDAASRGDFLQSELSMLKSQFEKERQRTTKQMEDAQTRFEITLKERDELIAMKEADTLTVQRELEQLEITHNRELEEAEANHSQKLHEIQRIEKEARQHIRELEAELATTTDERQNIQRTTGSEISSMGQVIQSLQDELQILKERKDHEIDALKVRLIQEHDEIMTRAQAEHELALQTAKDDANKISLTAASVHHEELQNLRTNLEKAQREHIEALSTLSASSSELQQELENASAKSSSIAEAKAVLESALQDASAEIAGLKKVLETFDQDSQGKEEQHASLINKMRDDLERTAQMLKEKDSQSSTLMEEHSVELESIRKHHADELEAIRAESMEKADGALRDLQEKHDLMEQDLQKAQDDSEASLNSLKVDHAELLREMIDSHNNELEELKQHQVSQLEHARTEAEAAAAEKLENAEGKHRKALEKLSRQHDENLATIKEGHLKVLSNLQDQVLQHRKDLAYAENELQSSRELQSSTEREARDKHIKELEEFRSQVSIAQADAAQSQKALENLQEQKVRIETVSEQQATELENLRNMLAEDKETIQNLTAAAEEANRLLSDASGANELKEELESLRQSHISEMVKLQETMSIEAEKREKERKQGAEVRDRLVGQLAELEKFRTEFPAAKDLAQGHLRAAEIARKEAKDAQDQLSAVIKEQENHQVVMSAKLDKTVALAQEFETRQQDLSAERDKALLAAKEHESHHQKALIELEKVRAELTKAKNRRLSQSAVGSEIMQELDALQIIADKERDKNDRLKKQIVEISATAEAHATRVREMEAALKVTTAELTEMKTKRADGKDFATTPISKKGLRTSRWAADSNDDGFVEVEGDPEGEELGSSIEGTVGPPFLSILIYYRYTLSLLILRCFTNVITTRMDLLTLDLIDGGNPGADTPT